MLAKGEDERKQKLVMDGIPPASTIQK